MNEYIYTHINTFLRKRYSKYTCNKAGLKLDIATLLTPEFKTNILYFRFSTFLSWISGVGLQNTPIASLQRGRLSQLMSKI